MGPIVHLHVLRVPGICPRAPSECLAGAHYFSSQSQLPPLTQPQVEPTDALQTPAMKGADLMAADLMAAASPTVTELLSTSIN